MSLAETFCLLLVAHAIADYPLQGEFLAKFKNPAAGPFMGEVIWPWILGSHAAIHAGFVGVITGSLLLAAAEFVAHCAIDLAKCRGWFGFNADQALHVGCKAVWIAILAYS
jgi:hypothetical protein